MHHLITDGWSFGVAAGELATSTRLIARAAHRLCRTADPVCRLRPLAARTVQSGAWTTQIEAWKRRLAGVPPLELPTDRPRPPIRSRAAPSIPWCSRRSSPTAVRAAARREGVTPFMTLLAAFQLVLGRWSGQDDFAVGSPVANRTRPETERLIGYFVNMIALRADLSGNPTVREFLARVREVALEAFENQEIPLEVLIPALGPRRDASRSPLFQVMFVLQNNAIAGGRPARPDFLSARSRPGDRHVEVRPLAGVRGHARGFTGSVEFNTDLFEAATIERFAQQYVKLLEYLIADPERRLSELSLLTDAERGQVVAWSQRAVRTCPRNVEAPARPEPSAIHGAFEAQVRATPDDLALVAGEERLTYAELNARANRLAHHLRARAPAPKLAGRPHPRRADQSDRGRARRAEGGGAYVPLEPSLPRRGWRACSTLPASRS